jgi:hypothetical protein
MAASASSSRRSLGEGGKHSSISFGAASGAAASYRAVGLPPEGRDRRGRKRMEATMRVLTVIELMCLTRIELTDLLIRITNALQDLREGSSERQNTLISLSNIRWALMRRDLTP